MTRPKEEKQNRIKQQFNSPLGYAVTAVVMLLIGYTMVSLAIDSGSLVHWAVALVAVIWGLIRLVQSVALALSKK